MLNKINKLTSENAQNLSFFILRANSLNTNWITKKSM